MRRLWLTTERLRHFFFPPFLILIKVLVQDKQCLPTLQFKQRGPLRPKRWFLNVHWQVGLICVLSRWRWTYIYRPYLACIRSPAISPPLWNFMVPLCLKGILVLHKFCCLVYICHAVLKVRTGPAVETWTGTYSGFSIPGTHWPWLRTSVMFCSNSSLILSRPLQLVSREVGTV